MLQQIKHSTVSNGIQRLQTPFAQTLLLLARDDDGDDDDADDDGE